MTEETKRKLWWAKLNSHSPRYQDWLRILGSDEVPLKSPGSSQTRLGEESDEVHLLDWENLSEPVKERLVAFLATKFKALNTEVRAELEKNGMPIRASDVTVFYDVRAFL